MHPKCAIACAMGESVCFSRSGHEPPQVSKGGMTACAFNSKKKMFPPSDSALKKCGKLEIYHLFRKVSVTCSNLSRN